jgi:hypothetical protein
MERIVNSEVKNGQCLSIYPKIIGKKKLNFWAFVQVIYYVSKSSTSPEDLFYRVLNPIKKWVFGNLRGREGMCHLPLTTAIPREQKNYGYAKTKIARH